MDLDWDGDAAELSDVVGEAVDSWFLDWFLCKDLGKENSLGYMLIEGDSVGHREEGRGFTRKACEKL